MTWDWVDLEAETVHIKLAKRGSNDLPMATPVKEAFLELGPHASGAVFPGHSRRRDARTQDDGSKPLTDKKWTLRSTLRRAGLDPRAFSFHSFRHSFVTLLEDCGVRALARHSINSGDITARYLHPTNAQLRQALDLLTAKVLGPATVIPLRIPGGYT